MRSPALWLAARELGARRRRVALAALGIAAIAAAATAAELVARAREDAIAARIDAMGPALTVVPRGLTAGALARRALGDEALSPGVEPAVRAALGRDLRAVEKRLVLEREVAGVRVPLIGVEAGVLPPELERRGGVALGAELARRLGAVSELAVTGRGYAVSGVMPSTGSAEDLAVILPIEELAALAGVRGANELRLFLAAGVSPREAEARLARAQLDAAVIRSDRGAVADGEAHGALARHRHVAHLGMAALAGLCLLIAAHLDAGERRVELATLVAIGASRWTVLGALLWRSALVAAAGAGLGVAAGAALAAAQDPAAAGAVARAGGVALSTVAAALALGVVAAAPTALASVARDPVRELQEG